MPLLARASPRATPCRASATIRSTAAACSSGTTTLSPARDGNPAAAASHCLAARVAVPAGDPAPHPRRTSLGRQGVVDDLEPAQHVDDRRWWPCCRTARSSAGPRRAAAAGAATARWRAPRLPTATCSGLASMTASQLSRPPATASEACSKQEGLDRRRPAVAGLAADVEVDAAASQHQGPGARGRPARVPRSRRRRRTRPWPQATHAPPYARPGDLVRLARRRRAAVRRGLPHRRRDRDDRLPRRPPRQAAAGRGPGRRRQDRAGQGGRRATGSELIRLQCYEGLDEARALYEWNYKKQLLRIQAAEDDDRWDDIHDDVFAEEFLLSRPLLTAIRRDEPTVLLIDETDKADVEVEGLLLEVLSDFQVTIPELGTIAASAGRSSSSPRTRPASCRRRSSGAASTCTWTTRAPSARRPSCVGGARDRRAARRLARLDGPRAARDGAQEVAVDLRVDRLGPHPARARPRHLDEQAVDERSASCSSTRATTPRRARAEAAATGDDQHGLVDRQIGFFDALREAGLPVSLAEVLDATCAARGRRARRPRGSARRTRPPCSSGPRTGRRSTRCSTCSSRGWSATRPPTQSRRRRRAGDGATGPPARTRCAPRCATCCSTATEALRRWPRDGPPARPGRPRPGRAAGSPTGAARLSPETCSGRRCSRPCSPGSSAAGREGRAADGGVIRRGRVGGPAPPGRGPGRGAVEDGRAAARRAGRLPAASRRHGRPAAAGLPPRSAPGHPPSRRRLAGAAAGSTSAARSAPRWRPAASRWSPTTGRSNRTARAGGALRRAGRSRASRTSR